MVASQKELKRIKQESSEDDNFKSGLEDCLKPIVNPIVPETLNELEYGVEKNSKNLVSKNNIVADSSNVPTNYNCNFILDPRYLTKEEKQNASVRLNYDMKSELAGISEKKKQNLSPRTLKNMHLRSNNQATEAKIAEFLNSNFMAVAGAIKVSKNERLKSKKAKKILKKDLLAQDIQKREVRPKL